MTLLSLPTELLIHTGTYVASLHTLNALARVNRRLYALFNPLLYQQDAQCSHRTAISWAAKHGRIRTLKRALSYGIGVPVHSTVGRVCQGSVQMFHGKSNLYYKVKGPAHPLCLAVKHGRADIVEFLVAQGCDINMTDAHYFSLLCVAAIYHRAQLVVKLLLSLGAHQNNSGLFQSYSPIYLAVFHNNIAAVASLLCYGSNSSRPTSRQMEDALECALRKHKHITHYLVGFVENLNFCFKEGRILDVGTPLLWAVEEEDIRLVELILNNGADPNFIPLDCYSTPALLRAVERNQEEIVRLLVWGTHRIQRTQALACSMNYPDGRIAKILLDNGTVTDFEKGDGAELVSMRNETNERDLWSEEEEEEEDELIPPLIRAVSLGNADLVRLLVAHGANVNVLYWGFIKTLSTRFMGGPLLLAMKLGDQDIVRFLRDHKARKRDHRAGKGG